MEEITYSKNFLRYVYSFLSPEDEKEMYEIIDKFKHDEFLVYMDVGGPIHIINNTMPPPEFKVGRKHLRTFSYENFEHPPILKYKTVYFSYPYVKEIYENVFNKSPFEMRFDTVTEQYFLEFILDKTYSLVLMEMYFLRGEENDFLKYNEVVNIFNVLKSAKIADDELI